MQINFAVTAKLISVFVFFATQIVQYLFSLNFKFLAISSDCAARFVWDLVGNPEDRFSHNEAHIKAVANVCLTINHLEAPLILSPL